MHNLTPLTPLHFLARAHDFFGGHPAVVGSRQTVSYRELYNRVCRISRALQALGVEYGESVAVAAPNSLEMLELHYAIPAAGAVITPLNPSLEPALLRAQLKQTEARVLIADPLLFDINVAAETGINTIVSIAADNGGRSGGRTYADLLEQPGDNGLLYAGLDEYDSISQFYTSGTTGDPKPIRHTHRAAYIAALSNALSFQLNPATVLLWSWPMFHSNGLSFIWAATSVAATHVCLGELTPADIFSALGTHNISIFCTPPNVLAELLPRHARLDQEVTCITGGAPLPPAVNRRAQDAGIRVIHQYGASEAFGPATVNWHGFDKPSHAHGGSPPDPSLQGKPTPAVHNLKVLDLDTGQPVPRNGIALGEIVISGSTLTASSADHGRTSQQGWLHTGDLGAWHADGSIEVKDRITDAIRTAQGYVSSLEIEHTIYDHPGIEAAAVVALRLADEDTRPCAFVMTDSTQITEAAIIKFCADRLPAHKVPRRVFFDALPLTATGKVQKRLLRLRAAKLAKS